MTDILQIKHNEYVNYRNTVTGELFNLVFIPQDVISLIANYCNCVEHAITPDEARNAKKQDELAQKYFTHECAAISCSFVKYALSAAMCTTPQTVADFASTYEIYDYPTKIVGEESNLVNYLRNLGNTLIEPIILHYRTFDHTGNIRRLSKLTTFILVPQGFLKGKVNIFLSGRDPGSIMKVPPEILCESPKEKDKLNPMFEYLDLVELNVYFIGVSIGDEMNLREDYHQRPDDNKVYSRQRDTYGTLTQCRSRHCAGQAQVRPRSHLERTVYRIEEKVLKN